MDTTVESIEAPGILRRLRKRARQLITISILVIPPLGVISALRLAWGVGVGPLDIALAIGLYLLTVIGVAVGFHRYFTHRSFGTSRALEAVLAILASMAIQGTTTGWVAEHRKHHALSDEEGDPHSPWTDRRHGLLGALGGLWHAHVGWFFSTKALDPTTRYARDLTSDRMIRTIDSMYPFWIALSFGLPFLVGYLVGGTERGVQALVWGGLVRIFLVHHVTWSVNSLGHAYGKQAYRSRDESRNTSLLVLPSLGEAYHNNHHAFPSSAVHGFDPGQVDIAGLIIRGLARIGLAWDVKIPDVAQRSRRRVDLPA